MFYIYIMERETKLELFVLLKIFNVFFPFFISDISMYKRCQSSFFVCFFFRLRKIKFQRQKREYLSRELWRKPHLWWRSHLLAGCEMSQQWRTKLTALLLSTLGSASVSKFFMFFNCWKWKLMSVARTMSITSDRNSRNSSLDRFCSMLQSFSLSILKIRKIHWKKKYISRNPLQKEVSFGLSSNFCLSIFI